MYCILTTLEMFKHRTDTVCHQWPFEKIVVRAMK